MLSAAEVAMKQDMPNWLNPRPIRSPALIGSRVAKEPSVLGTTVCLVLLAATTLWVASAPALSTSAWTVPAVPAAKWEKLVTTPENGAT